MIKVSITNETNQDCVTSTWCIEDITSLIFLTNMHNLNLDYEEKMASPNWGTFYKINGLYYAKLSKPMKYKTKECFRWENRDDDWMHPVILDWEEDWYKGHYWDNWGNLNMVFGMGNSKASMLNVLILRTIQLCKKMPWI